jgi:hypothetical protein
MAINRPQSAEYSRNWNRYSRSGDHELCFVCGRPIKAARPLMAHIHIGGNTIVTEAEAEELNRDGGDRSDLGMHPIGADCYKQHKDQLEGYVRRSG